MTITPGAVPLTSPNNIIINRFVTLRGVEGRINKLGLFIINRYCDPEALEGPTNKLELIIPKLIVTLSGVEGRINMRRMMV